jgi:phosphate transport system substrate-binding protein
MTIKLLGKIIISIILIISAIQLLIIFVDENKKVNYMSNAPFGNIGGSEIELNKKIAQEIPTVYSAIAAYPFSSSIVEATIDSKYYKDELKHVSTQEAYQSIVDNIADIAIASETSKEQQRIINNIDDIEMIPIAKDALVFFINKSNNTDSFTVQELKNIYNGNNLDYSPYSLQTGVG